MAAKSNKVTTAASMLETTVSRKGFVASVCAGLGALTLSSCGQVEPQKEDVETEPAAETPAASNVDLDEFKALDFDSRSWHYDAENNIWWQLGLAYCTKPATQNYETLAMYVPGAYLKPVDESANISKATSNDIFECEFDTEAVVGAFTCETAPIVMPINTIEFAAQTPASAYLPDGLSAYLDAGLVYVYAGCRGRSNGYDNTALTGDGFFAGGAPWSVVELKAAVRYLKYNGAKIPGSTERIIAFGMSSGGLLASIMGASGSSAIYEPYLTEIGAATHDAEGNTFGDEICGVATWCPDAPPAHADAAYEWEVGQFTPDEGGRDQGVWTLQLSNDLAQAYATSVNDLGLAADGSSLALVETDGGVYTDGSYYEHLLNLLETSAETFFANAEFPIAVSTHEEVSGYFPGSGKSEEEMRLTSSSSDASASVDSTSTSADTYPLDDTLYFATHRDYVNSLNQSYRWITYSQNSNSVRIAGLSSYAAVMRTPSLSVCSFDAPDRSALTNQLFGDGETDSLHYSQDIADTLAANSEIYEQMDDFDSELSSEWAVDLQKKDPLKQSMETRRNMYDPLYFIGSSMAGFGTATVAPHWRINLGLSQTSMPLTPAVNLALALEAYDGVEDVAFEPVWGAPRSLAEPNSADPAEAFTAWIVSLFTE